MPDIDPSQLTDEQIRAVMAEAGRRGAGKRVKADRVCRACGTTIPDALVSKRYCSDACRQRARYWRKQDLKGDPTAPFRLPLAGLGWQDARSYRPQKKRTRA
jgi:hypothetical protein